METILLSHLTPRRTAHRRERRPGQAGCHGQVTAKQGEKRIRSHGTSTAKRESHTGTEEANSSRTSNALCLLQV